MVSVKSTDKFILPVAVICLSTVWPREASNSRYVTEYSSTAYAVHCAMNH